MSSKGESAKQALQESKSKKTGPPETKTKKPAPHAVALAEAAKYNTESAATNNSATQSNPNSEDYELGKVSRSKKEAYNEESNMVKDLDRWG